jgi:PKHD-type hydroxylase
MISSYFTEQKFDLNKIPPVINPEDFKNSGQNFWYLKNHDYQSFAYMDDVFDEDEVNQIIKLGNLYVEEQAQIGGAIGEVNKDIRACKLAWMFPNRYTEWIYQRIAGAVNQINEEYFKFDLTKLENFQFTKYKEEESGFYGKHTDPIMGQYIPENRKLSLVMQLSNPNEYEGGDLCLYVGKEPTVIEKKKGRIIFFPSYTLHEVKPVTQGTRYTLVGWTHGPAFK